MTMLLRIGPHQGQQAAQQQQQQQRRRQT
jgi:hypothetical protein